MEYLIKFLPYIQVSLAVLLIIIILLQQSGSSLGSSFGGSDDSLNTTRRGIEKTLLKLTIFLAFLFVVSTIVALLIY